MLSFRIFERFLDDLVAHSTMGFPGDETAKDKAKSAFAQGAA